MSTHHTGSRDTTANHKKYRLAITFPGRPTRYITDGSKKVLRAAQKRYREAGAAAEIQKHLGYNRYTTADAREPEQTPEAAR